MGSMVYFPNRRCQIIFLNHLASSLRCPVGAHWKCLASTQRDEVLKAVRQRDQEQWEATQKNGGDASTPPKKRNELSIDQTTEFICGKLISFPVQTSLIVNRCMYARWYMYGMHGNCFAP